MGAEALITSTILHWINTAIYATLIIMMVGGRVADCVEQSCSRLERVFERWEKVADAFGRAGAAWQRFRRRSQAARAAWRSRHEDAEPDQPPPDRAEDVPSDEDTKALPTTLKPRSTDQGRSLGDCEPETGHLSCGNRG
jgi:hypothetical protein